MGTSDEAASSVRSFLTAAGVDAVNVRVRVAGAQAEAAQYRDVIGQRVV